MTKPVAVAPLAAADVPAVTKSVYPAPFVVQVEGRSKRKLGDAFGLKNFGVNYTTLPPGKVSALLHHHATQDEFVLILAGEAVVRVDDVEYPMVAGDCIGFAAGTGISHQLLNRSDAPLVYIEVGDRSLGDLVQYPKDDLQAIQQADASWRFVHKNGDPW